MKDCAYHRTTLEERINLCLLHLLIEMLPMMLVKNILHDIASPTLSAEALFITELGAAVHTSDDVTVTRLNARLAQVRCVVSYNSFS